MADAIRKNYPHIKQVAIDHSLQPRQAPAIERPLVSFSGGVDSVAAAALLESGTPLILNARVQHPKIGEFEKWYKTEGNIQTLAMMPDRFEKYPVYSDFEFLSTNGSYCLYPDSYAFTIPCMLLADHLSATHIVTGDIWVAFTGDETIYNPRLSYRNNFIFWAVGLSIEPPLNGVGELGSMIIAEHCGLRKIATTCQYGKFQEPCMKCIKCFRKSLYSWALFGEALSSNDIIRFNSSPAVKSFAENSERKGLAFMPTYKHVFSSIGEKFNGPTGAIRDRAIALPIDPAFVSKIYGPAYDTIRPQFVARVYEKLLNLMPLMQDLDIHSFSSLDYRKTLSPKN
jgi:hypothetical protein